MFEGVGGGGWQINEVEKQIMEDHLEKNSGSVALQLCSQVFGKWVNCREN